MNDQIIRAATWLEKYPTEIGVSLIIGLILLVAAVAWFETGEPCEKDFLE